MGQACCCLGVRHCVGPTKFLLPSKRFEDDAVEQKREESNTGIPPKEEEDLNTPLLKDDEPVVVKDPKPSTSAASETEPLIAAKEPETNAKEEEKIEPNKEPTPPPVSETEPEPLVQEISKEPEPAAPEKQEEKVEPKKEDTEKEVSDAADGGGAMASEGMKEEDVLEMLQNELNGLVTISAEKVNAKWIEKRGADASDPKRENIEYAISKSDTNKNGKLEMDEMTRLTGAFVNHSGDVNMTSEKLFAILDENNDGVLNAQEVLTTFKAMYLMKSNGVQLEELLQDE